MTLSASGTAPILQPGIHIVQFFASDGSDATSINPLLERYDSLAKLSAPKRPESGDIGKELVEPDSPESAPVIGGINAYLFMVPALAPTAASVSVSGRILAGKGSGVFRAQVSITDSLGHVRTSTTNQFGYFSFENVAAGQVYVFDVRSKEYSFVPQILNISEDVRDLIFTAQ